VPTSSDIEPFTHRSRVTPHNPIPGGGSLGDFASLEKEFCQPRKDAGLGSPRHREASMPFTIAEIRAPARQRIEAWNDKNLDRIMEHYAADVEFGAKTGD
jgi:hypothetical protein